jgi:GNAT superfamily N-acetyltransferase
VPTPDSLRIEPVTDADIPVLYTLIKALAEYERLGHMVVSTEDDFRTALLGPRPVIEAVIARVDGTPVGYALWFHTFSTFLGQRGLYLEDLFVLPEYRGQGVGRALLAHLANIAVERGCGRMEWVVLDWNEPAIGFYKKIGGEPLTDWQVFRLTGEALEKLGKSGTGEVGNWGTGELKNCRSGD